METASLLEAIAEAIASSPHPQETAAAIRQAAHAAGPNASSPIDAVVWLPMEAIQPNDYNPNAVARAEMALLRRSIRQDGYTQPLVVARDGESYVIIDGFHRFKAMADDPEIAAAHHGRLPCVILEKTPAQRMAATVRHNRARGRHAITGMANLVFRMLDQGLEDRDICSELGMEPEELVRIKHITGFSKLWADHEYRHAWMTRNQIAAMHEYTRGSMRPPGNGESGETRACARPDTTDGAAEGEA